MLILANLSLSGCETVSGSISAAFSGFVILTLLLFSEFRNLRYVELVFYVSINDMIGSIGIALGAVPNGSPACWFQAITTNLNYLASIFWTTVISYQVWLIVYKGEILMDMVPIHFICWGIPIIFTFLPLITNAYGNNDDEGSWCFLTTRSNSPGWGLIVWELLAFYIWLWAAIIINFYFLVSISMRMRSMAVVSADISGTLKKLVWYPIIIIVCWASATVIDIYENFEELGDDPVDVYANRGSTVLAILQGSLLALVFFAANPMIRQRWVYFVKNGFSLRLPVEMIQNEFNIEAQTDYVAPDTMKRSTLLDEYLHAGRQTSESPGSVTSTNTSKRARASNMSKTSSNDASVESKAYKSGRKSLARGSALNDGEAFDEAFNPI